MEKCHSCLPRPLSIRSFVWNRASSLPSSTHNNAIAFGATETATVFESALKTGGAIPASRSRGRSECSVQLPTDHIRSEPLAGVLLPQDHWLWRARVSCLRNDRCGIVVLITKLTKDVFVRFSLALCDVQVTFSARIDDVRNGLNLLSLKLIAGKRTEIFVTRTVDSVVRTTAVRKVCHLLSSLSDGGLDPASKSSFTSFTRPRHSLSSLKISSSIASISLLRNSSAFSLFPSRKWLIARNA